MSRRAKNKVFTEELALQIIRSKGDFQLNPLATRNKQKAKVLERMRVKGVLAVIRFAISNYLYTVRKT